MAERTPPLHLQNATTHTAAGDRALIHSMFNGREGVSGSADLAVAQNGTPNMSVNIASGRAVVFGDDSADQQLYHIWNDATVNKTISAADPTNPRRDLVIAEVRDTLFGGAANDWRLSVVTGTPAASPADPSVPNTALVLARVAVAAGATSVTNANITDLRARAGAVGVSDVICTSTTRPASPFVGMKIYETDTAKALVYAGATSGWSPPWNLSWGRQASVVVTADTGSIVGTIVDITGATVSWTAVAGRRYKATFKAEVSSSVGGDTPVLSLTNASNADYDRVTKPLTSTGGETFAGVVEITGVSGATVAKLRGIRAAGSGTLTIGGGATRPCSIIIEDIGPSANPT